ncbi:MAG: helix-turn-helix domain-containing protein [Eubacterium sp.]|uniref:helix-turn-helix domain-containing protein n=1 Tax=Eubacterium sp. Marseille-QA0814 TaxID=3378778 RepID=UPI003A14B4B5
MKTYVWETTEEIDKNIAGRLRNIRKRHCISQEKLSEISGVSYGSIKRFESTGQISLKSLTKIATSLGVVNEIRSLFTDVPYRNIQEVINEGKQ